MAVLNLNKDENKVYQILTHFKLVRDDDFQLYYQLITQYYNCNVEKISGADLLRKQRDGKLPNFQSVSRLRRKLQELFPECRGANWAKRHEQQKEAEQEIIHFKSAIKRN